MSRADEIRAALAVAELEEELADRKAGDDPEALADCKTELRYARWVARGGPQEETARIEAGDGHTNRAVADLYERWQSEGQEV